jgi:hypothetical protein
MRMKKATIFFWGASIVVVCIHLSNIWRLRTYPFTDLPSHLAEAYLLRTLTLNPNDSLEDYYRIDIAPYTPATLHTVFCALFPDIEIGNKIFYTLCMLLIFTGMLLLIRSAQGDPWLAILITMFYYHFSVKWGFVGYTAGVGLVILVMVMLVRYLDCPSLWYALVLALTLLAVYYAHTTTWLFVVACVSLIVLTYRGIDLKNRLLGLFTLIPGFVLFLIWQFRAEGFGNYKPTLPFLLSYYHSEYLASLKGRIIELFLLDNSYLAIGQRGEILSIVFTMPLVVGFLILVFHRRASILKSISLSSRYCGVIFLFVAGICYLVLPNRLPGEHFIYERIAVIVFLGIIWVGGFLVSKRLHLPLRVMVTLLVLIHTGLWFRYFQSFNLDSQPFRTILYHNPAVLGRPLAALINSPDFRGHPAYSHYQNYQIIWNHGVVPTAIVMYRFRFIQMSEAGILPFYYEKVGIENRFKRVLIQYREMDLLLVDSQQMFKNIKKYGGYRLIDRVDSWILLENISTSN